MPVRPLFAQSLHPHLAPTHPLRRGWPCGPVVEGFVSARHLLYDTGMSELTVSDLMSTALLTVTPDETIGRADLEMKLAGIRHFPVVDKRNHLVGVLSDRDLLRAFGDADVTRVKVADVMTVNVETVTEETAAIDAVTTMIEHKFGCLPVVGEAGQLVGLVTETDFLLVAHRALAGEDLGR